MKRGVTPLIATVLIIGIVVILTTLTVFFLGDIIDSETGKIGDQTDIENYCLQGVDLEIDPPCREPVDGNLSIKIKNRANGNLSGFLFQVVEGGNSITFDRNLNLPSFGAKRYSLNFTGNYSQVREIIVVPKVASETVEAACSEILLSLDYILYC